MAKHTHPEKLYYGALLFYSKIIFSFFSKEFAFVVRYERHRCTTEDLQLRTNQKSRRRNHQSITKSHRVNHVSNNPKATTMEFAKKIVRTVIGVVRNEPDDCPVCLDPMNQRIGGIIVKPWTRRTTLKPCKHQFCAMCLLTLWKVLYEEGEEFRCPLCRQNADFKV